jgi:hypothetical protein
MKVRELIEELQKMPSDSRVKIIKPAGHGYVAEFDSISTPWVDPFGDTRIQIATAEVTAEATKEKQQ